MPKALHGKLERQARRRGLKGKRKDAYVYGTMNKIEKSKHHSASDGDFLSKRKGKFGVGS